MNSSKIDRARYGPGWAEVLFGAVLSALLGVLVCAAWLVWKPVPKLMVPPKTEDAYSVYYIRGSTDPDLGQAWLRKRHALLNGQSINLSEEELNTAAVTRMERPRNEQGGEEGASLTPGEVNFRIVGNQLQVAVPVKVALLGRSIIVQATGGFAREGRRFVFAPSQIYVGSCPVGRLPFVASLILRRLYSSQSVPDDLVAAWDKLSGVSIADGRLKLDAGP